MQNYSLEDAFKALEDIDEGIYIKTEVKSLKTLKNNVKLQESESSKVEIGNSNCKVKSTRQNLLRESKVNEEQLKLEVEKGLKKFFSEDEEMLDYTSVSIEKLEDGIMVSVGAEVDYDTLDEMCESLNSIVKKYDADAYFEPADSGLAECFIRTSLKEEKEEVSVENSGSKDDDLVKFIENSIESLKNDDDNSSYYFNLDENYAVVIKYEEGFDEDDKNVIHSKSEPGNAICSGIFVRDSDYFVDAWNMPYLEDGDVLDTDSAIPADFDAQKEASELMEWYDEFKNKYTLVSSDGLVELNEEPEEELKEAKSHDEYNETGFGTTKDGKEIFASGSTDQTRTYWREHVKLEIEGLGTGYGNYKWMNRPWQRWDYASALEDAMIDLGIDNKLAKECIENSLDLRSAIKYLASKLETSNKVEEGKTSAQKYNDRLEKVFNNFENQNKKMANILIKNGVSEDEVKKLKDNTGLHGNALHQKIIELGLEKELKEGVDWDFLNKIRNFKEDEVLDAVKKVHKRIYDEIKEDGFKWALVAELLTEPEREKVLEILNKSNKELKESPVTELEPKYDSRKSFYKKAKVDDRGDGSKVLYSYGTPVVGIKDGKATLLNRGYYGWSSSQTTLRHVKDFLQQEGFKSGSIKDIVKMYPIMQYDEWNSNKIEENKKNLKVSNKELNEDKIVNLGEEEEAKEGKEFLKKSEENNIEKVVDVDANTVEKLKDSYIGNVILQCPICKTLIYKAPEDLEKDGDDSISLDDALYNVDETCPHCGGKDGFKLVGQVSSLDNKEESTNEEEKPEPIEEPSKEENRPEEIKGEELPEEQDEDNFVEGLTIKDLNEEKFDKLVNKYLHEIYENVESYTTQSGSIDDKNNIFVEGIIKYKDGKEANTKFKLEAKELTKGGKYKFTALNETFSKSKKAFTFVSTIKDNKLMCESLSFKYSVKVLNENKLVRGKVSLKNSKK